MILLLEYIQIWQNIDGIKMNGQLFIKKYKMQIYLFFAHLFGLEKNPLSAKKLSRDYTDSLENLIMNDSMHIMVV